jgi:chromosome partitioning protein
MTPRGLANEVFAWRPKPLPGLAIRALGGSTAAAGTQALRAAAPRPASLSDVRVFAIANQKGGVGKTTTAVNLAAAVAAAGYEALIVDLDPQTNATVGLGQPRNLSPNVYDVLCGEYGAEQAVHPTPVDRLWLMPAGPGLVGASVELPTVSGSERRLREALAPLRERFAFILIDCPPSLGPLTVNALVAADRVIVPVQTEYFALEGLAQVLDTISLIQREFNPRLTVAGMLLTMHDGRTRLGRDVERDVREHFPGLVFETVIPRNIRISEAPSFGVPVTLHDPFCVGSDAYTALAREVAAGG